MEMTVKAVADNKPNVRREGTPKYHQAMDSELLEVYQAAGNHDTRLRYWGQTLKKNLGRRGYWGHLDSSWENETEWPTREGTPTLE